MKRISNYSNKNSYIINNITPCKLFFGIWICAAIASVISLLSTHGACLDKIIAVQGNDRFMDFFNHISYTHDMGPDKNVYSVFPAAVFPPFIYFMYYFFSLILPDGAVVFNNPGAMSAYAQLLYVWYSTLVSAAMVFTIIKATSRWKTDKQLALACVVLFSNIFIFYTLERGNSAPIVFIMLMWACMLKDSKSKVKRELALILIAMAAATKIYTVVFGFIYLFEKRWKEAARLIIYGIIFFFGPFIVFGGAQGFIQLMTNQLGLQNGAYYDLRSIKSIFNFIMGKIGVEPNQTVSSILVFIYLILSMGGIVVHKTLWKKLCLLVSIMILCPTWSCFYTLSYLIIPLVYFLLHIENGWSKYDFIYAVLFAVIFSLWTVEPGVTSNSLAETLQYPAVYILNFILIGEAIHEFLKNRSQYLSYLKRK